MLEIPVSRPPAALVRFTICRHDRGLELSARIAACVVCSLPVGLQHNLIVDVPGSIHPPVHSVAACGGSTAAAVTHAQSRQSGGRGPRMGTPRRRRRRRLLQQRLRWQLWRQAPQRMCGWAASRPCSSSSARSDSDSTNASATA